MNWTRVTRRNRCPICDKPDWCEFRRLHRTDGAGRLSNTVMSAILANRSAQDRPATDFYATPYDCTVALLDYLKLPTRLVIWEPAAGKGHIVKVCRDCCYQVVSSDIDDGTDFLKCDVDYSYDWIITNPPFNLSEQFIERAATLGKPFAFLLKSQYWHSARRVKLFQKYRPKYVLPLSWRPDFLFGAKGGAPTMEVHWTVWEPPYTSATVYDILSR